MISDFIKMNLVPGEKPIPLQEGQTVLVEYEGVPISMRVLYVYSDGTFDGEVDWPEA